jgi:hypothetical protein
VELIQDLQNVQKSILEELKKSNYDSLKLVSYSNEIGSLHSRLKMNTIDFYLSLKRVCSPSQQDSLYVIFREMSQFSDFPLLKRGMHRHGPENERWTKEDRK